MKNKLFIFCALALQFVFLGNAQAQWLLNGNGGVTPMNFIGTTNNADLIFKANSLEVGRFTTGNSGMIGKANTITAGATGAFAAVKSNSLGINSHGSIALGEGNSVTSTRGYAFGRANTSSNVDATCIGYNNTASGNLSFAIGQGMNNNIPSSILLGFMGANTMFITETQVGIRTIAPDPFSTLDVFGDIYSYGVWTGSDRRYKKEIRTLDKALDKILALRGTEYLFRTDEMKEKNFPEGKQIGFIAQEVEQVLPDLVRSNGGTRYTVNYIGMIPVIVEAMKEQQMQISEKDAAIACLQNKVDGLEARLAKIESMLNQLPQEDRAIVPAKAEKSFGIVPNPTAGQFQLKLPETNAQEATTVLIFDSKGREVARQVLDANNLTPQFNLELANGVYNVTIMTKGKVSATQSFVVAK